MKGPSMRIRNRFWLRAIPSGWVDRHGVARTNAPLSVLTRGLSGAMFELANGVIVVVSIAELAKALANWPCRQKFPAAFTPFNIDPHADTIAGCPVAMTVI